MKLALKIDVNTYLGTRDGVPRLIDILKAHGAGATFLFTLGPDRSGRAINRLFHPGVFSRAWRNQIVRSYGLRTLLYGTLLPAPTRNGRAGRWTSPAPVSSKSLASPHGCTAPPAGR